MGHTRICDAYRQLVRLYYSVSRAIKVLLHLLLSNFVRTWDYGTLYGFTTAVLAHIRLLYLTLHTSALDAICIAPYIERVARGRGAWRVGTFFQVPFCFIAFASLPGRDSDTDSRRDPTQCREIETQ